MILRRALFHTAASAHGKGFHNGGTDVWRWPQALPDGGADFAVLNGGAAGLFFAGDYTAGQGRVHLAIESGWRAAAAIERALGGRDS